MSASPEHSSRRGVRQPRGPAELQHGAAAALSGEPVSAQRQLLRRDAHVRGIGRGRIEITPQISVEPSISFNWIDLPQGQFDQHVAVTRLTYTMTPRAYVSGLVQYNSGNDTFSGNLRFRWEWAPGSELFLVYTEDRDTDVFDRWSVLRNRGFVIKVNRLLRI